MAKKIIAKLQILVLSLIFVLLAKLNYLRIAIADSNFKQVLVVIPEIITLSGYFGTCFLHLASGKILKELLQEFEVEWEMSEFH